MIGLTRVRLVHCCRNGVVPTVFTTKLLFDCFIYFISGQPTTRPKIPFMAPQQNGVSIYSKQSLLSRQY